MMQIPEKVKRQQVSIEFSANLNQLPSEVNYATFDDFGPTGSWFSEASEAQTKNKSKYHGREY
jgi:hypothetical protein